MIHGRLLRVIEGSVVPLALSFVLVLWLVPLAKRLAFWADAVARPNDRTLHEGAIPRLAGLALGSAVLLSTALLTIWPIWEPGLYILQGPPDFFRLMMWGGAAALFLGTLDDLFDPPALLKLGGQFAVAALPVFALVGPHQWDGGAWGAGIRVEHFPWPGYVQEVAMPGWLGAALAMLWIVVCINVVNFCDGIDGQILLAALVQFITYLVIFYTLGQRERGIYFETLGIFHEAFLLLLIGACLGMLSVNWPPASQFLGDGGSHFLGYLMAVIPLYITQGGTQHIRVVGEEYHIVQLSIIGAIVLMSPLLFDVGLTLIKRIWRGENPMKAHREHLYQRLVLAGYSHKTVILLNLPYYLWNALLAFAAMRTPAIPVQLGCLALSALTWIDYWYIVRTLEGMKKSTA